MITRGSTPFSLGRRQSTPSKNAPVQNALAQSSRCPGWWRASLSSSSSWRLAPRLREPTSALRWSPSSTPAGEVLGHLGERAGETVELGYGLAVNDSSGDVYYSDFFQNRVLVYNSVNVPTVVTGPPSEVKHGSAAVEGTVNPEGATITRCFVEYGAGQQQPCNLFGAQIGTGNSPVTVTAKLEGLEPDKLYGYRLLAEAEGQLGKGAELQFTTLPLAPGVSTDAVGSGPAADSVMLAGSVDPEGVAATCHFDYGLSSSYGQSAPAPSPELPPATSGQYVTLTLSGLTPGTIYHYRLVASNAGGTTYGPDQTFTTYATAPTVATGPAQNVEPSTAQLTGTLNARGADTTYSYQYGTTIYYSTAAPVPAADAGSSTADQSMITNISGLTPSTGYHYRLVASNAGGTSYGSDHHAPAALQATPPTPTPTTTVTPPAGKARNRSSRAGVGPSGLQTPRSARGL